MKSILSFADAQAALADIYQNRTVPRDTHTTLEPMAALMAAVGNPHTRLKAVHIAGTSGKTSTAYYSAALLRGAGFKVGLAVSPHVEEMNDRVQINMVPVPEPLFCAELQEYLGLVHKAKLENSFYELMLGFALWEFDRQQVDCAVLEVGVGGLLDPTNIVQRQDKVCVVTDIGLDHMRLLGDTMGEIAEKKAGIIGFRNTVFCYRQGDDVMRAIRDRCRQQQASLHVLTEADYKPASVALPLFQRRNFSIAYAAVEVVCERRGVRLSKKAVEQALLTIVPGRMETVQFNGKTVIVDGAHNGQKMAALIDSVRQKYPDTPVAALVAFSENSAAEERLRTSLAALKPHITRLIVTEFSGDRDGPHKGVPTDLLARVAQEMGIKTVESEPSPEKAYDQLLQAPESLLLVTGSFYLLNHIRPLLPCR